jgi:hypothetical protein
MSRTNFVKMNKSRNNFDHEENEQPKSNKVKYDRNQKSKGQKQERNTQRQNKRFNNNVSFQRDQD